MFEPVKKIGLMLLGAAGAADALAVPPVSPTPIERSLEGESSLSKTSLPDSNSLSSSNRASQASLVCYKIEKGDTLWNIATRYLGSGHKNADILAINPGLQKDDMIEGFHIKLPAGSTAPQSVLTGSQIYTIKDGDTIMGLREKFDIPNVVDFLELNPPIYQKGYAYSEPLPTGHLIVIPGSQEPKTQADVVGSEPQVSTTRTAPEGHIEHVVLEGESFSDLGFKYFNDGNCWVYISEANPELDFFEKLNPGSVVLIPLETPTGKNIQLTQDPQAVQEEPFQELVTEDPGIASVIEHCVTAEDSINSLALKYYGDSNMWVPICDLNPSLDFMKPLVVGETLLISKSLLEENSVVQSESISEKSNSDIPVDSQENLALLPHCKLFTAKGAAFLKNREGFSQGEYKCIAGKDTIGYGVQVTNTDITGQVTIVQAEDAMLRYIGNRCEPAIQQYVKVPLSENETLALISFIFNVGEGAFANSTLLTKLNKSDYEGAASEFKRWNKFTDKDTGEKKVSTGLQNRRGFEEGLFRTKQTRDWFVPSTQTIDA